MQHRSPTLPLRTLLVTLALFSGCGDGTGPDGYFVLTGTWAGASWAGDAEAFLVRGAPVDTLYLFAARGPDHDVPEETISVRVPFTGPGRYPLDRDAVAFWVLVGGDVVAGEYQGRGPAAGALEVDVYEASAGLISGTIVFDAEVVGNIKPYGSGARFENGEFLARVRLWEQP